MDEIQEIHILGVRVTSLWSLLLMLAVLGAVYPFNWVWWRVRDAVQAVRVA